MLGNFITAECGRYLLCRRLWSEQWWVLYYLVGVNRLMFMKFLVCIASWENGTRCRDGVKVLWCCSHLVWLVSEGSIPTVFVQKTFFVTSLLFFCCCFLFFWCCCCLLEVVRRWERRPRERYMVCKVQKTESCCKFKYFRWNFIDPYALVSNINKKKLMFWCTFSLPKQILI